MSDWDWDLQFSPYLADITQTSEIEDVTYTSHTPILSGAIFEAPLGGFGGANDRTETSRLQPVHPEIVKPFENPWEIQQKVDILNGLFTHRYPLLLD